MSGMFQVTPRVTVTQVQMITLAAKDWYLRRGMRIQNIYAAIMADAESSVKSEKVRFSV